MPNTDTKRSIWRRMASALEAMDTALDSSAIDEQKLVELERRVAALEIMRSEAVHDEPIDE